MNNDARLFNTRQYMLQKYFEAFYYIDFNPITVAPHRHNNFEFYFFLEGNVTYIIGSKSYDLSAGDVLLIPKHIPHYPLVKPTTQYRRLVFWVTADFIDEVDPSGSLLEFSPSMSTTRTYPKGFISRSPIRAGCSIWPTVWPRSLTMTSPTRRRCPCPWPRTL